MTKHNQASRRKFLQQIGATSLLAATSPLSSLAAKEKAEENAQHPTVRAPAMQHPIEEETLDVPV